MVLFSSNQKFGTSTRRTIVHVILPTVLIFFYFGAEIDVFLRQFYHLALLLSIASSLLSQILNLLRNYSYYLYFIGQLIIYFFIVVAIFLSSVTDVICRRPVLFRLVILPVPSFFFIIFHTVEVLLNIFLATM